MSFYGSLQSTADSLIRDKGQLVAVKRIAKSFDPITSVTSAATKVEGQLAVVVLPFNKTDKERMDDRLLQSLRDGKLRKLLIAAKDLAFEPAPLDIITLESKSWSIVGLTPLNPAGTALLYYSIIELVTLSAVDAAATSA